jgi:hypothetical protein
MASVLSDLKKALGNGDKATVDTLFKELSKAPLDEDIRGAISRASELASFLEYAEAAKAIEGIMGQ